MSDYTMGGKYKFCWSDDIEEKKAFYKQSPIEDLLYLANHGGFIEDTYIVLRELADRGLIDDVIKAAKSILDENKGDWKMQIETAEILLEHDKEYVINFMRDNEYLSEMCHFYGYLARYCQGRTF